MGLVGLLSGVGRITKWAGVHTGFTVWGGGGGGGLKTFGIYVMGVHKQAPSVAPSQIFFAKSILSD